LAHGAADVLVLLDGVLQVLGVLAQLADGLADLLGRVGQLLRAEHEQGDDQDHQDLAHSESEHRARTLARQIRSCRNADVLTLSTALPSWSRARPRSPEPPSCRRAVSRTVSTALRICSAARDCSRCAAMSRFTISLIDSIDAVICLEPRVCSCDERSTCL